MKIAVFGGSVSSVPESEVAKDIWREELNAAVITYGVGGMGFSKNTGEDNIQAQVERAIEKEPYDVYVFWASNNDIFQGHPIGDYKDYTETDNYDKEKLITQCGGINYCFKRVFETNSRANVIFFTTFKSNYDGERSFDPFYLGGVYEYLKAQIKCCNYWGVPCLDQFINIPFNDYNMSLYFMEDKVHLTKEGYAFVGNIQAQFIKNNISRR